MNHQAIYNTHPTARNIRDDNVFDIDGNPVAINESRYDIEVLRLQAESDVSQYQRDRAATYDSKAYARARAEAYASTGDQLDMQYHDLQDSTTTWADHVAEIKARYPK